MLIKKPSPAPCPFFPEGRKVMGGKKAVGWEAGGEKRYLQIRLTFLGLCRSPNQACGYFQDTSQIRESDLRRAEINTDRIILRTCTDPTEG